MDITKSDRATLKSYFVKNAVPTAGHFADLIDGMINQKEDGIAKLPGEPLSLQAHGDDTSHKKAINFYRNFTDPNPAWTLSLNPRADPNSPATAKAGWSIGDAAGASRLFIDQATGNIGVGTVTPGGYKLNVSGSALFAGNYLYVSSETAGRLRVGAAWNMPGLYSGDDGAKPLVLGVPSGQKVYLGSGSGDAFVEGGTGNAYLKGNVGVGTAPSFAKLDVNGILKAAGTFNSGKDPDSGISYGGNLVIKGNAPQIDFVDTDNNDWSIHVNSNKLYFIRQPWNHQDLVLDGNGNVGIGTDNPQNTLQLGGNLHMVGNSIFLRGDDPKDQYDVIKWNRGADRVDIGGWNGVSLGYTQGTPGNVTAVVTVGKDGIVQQAWQPVAFQNAWRNYGGGYDGAGYFKDSMGIVHLRGLVAGGGINTIFTLPPGYRPGARKLFVCATNPNVAGRLDVTAAGEVTVVAGNSGWLSLDGLTFKAEG